GVSWDAALLLAPALAGWAVLFLGRLERGPVVPRVWRGLPGAAALAAGAVGLALVAYAAGSARAASAGLPLFWGAKAQPFASARRRGGAFLAAGEHYYRPPASPPLVTLLEAWACLFAGRFAWGASLLTLPLCLAGSAFVFRDLARGALGPRAA